MHQESKITAWHDRLARLLTAACLLTATTVSHATVGHVTHYSRDALGSPIAATDEAGNLLWREEYRPYGDKINNDPASAINSRAFTGHPHDDTTGLTYAGARHYDPVVGRFMGVDPKSGSENSFPLVSHAAEQTVFYHLDALGSPIVASDEGGNLLWREEYRPYGDKIQNDPAGAINSRAFTGHPHDDITGLTYAGARHYDPVVGRFMGVDPKPVEDNDPYSFNRYAYGNNNPYKYVDPDGQATTCAYAMGDSFSGGGCGSGGSGGGDLTLGEISAVLSPMILGGNRILPSIRSIDAGRNTSRSFDTGGPTTTRPTTFPDGKAQIEHIFRKSPNHIPDTPANRQLLKDVANDSRTTLGTDRYGNTWSGRIQPDGTQVWVQSRNGIIQNAGINQTPRTFDRNTGLAAPSRSTGPYP